MIDQVYIFVTKAKIFIERVAHKFFEIFKNINFSILDSCGNDLANESA